MQALESSAVATALISHFKDRRQFHGSHFGHGLVQSYLSDDPINPALAFVLELPEEVSNTALGRIEESLYIREQIEHPHLGPLLERGRLDDRMVYWLVGIGWSRTISDVLTEPHPNQMRLINLMLQVGEGLEAMHDEGLFFGGLNEKGIFVGLNRDGQEKAFLAGCSVDAWIPELRTVELHRLDLRQAYVLAPECVAGGSRSIASDLYAYGALLFRVFTGRYPFEAPTVEELFDAHLKQIVCTDEERLPEALWSTVLQCLRKDPHLRPDSISEVLSCLRIYLAGGYEVPLNTSDFASVDESSVPGTMALEFEKSEDILCAISDYLESGSDEDSTLSLVEHNEQNPPVLPDNDENEVTETNLTGNVVAFEIEDSESRDHEQVPPFFTSTPTEGGLTLSVSSDWEDENTEDVSEVELHPQPLSVVVGVVPYQSDELNMPREQLETQLIEDGISIDGDDGQTALMDIAQAARFEIADAISIISEEQHEEIALPAYVEAMNKSPVNPLNSEDILIHEAAMIADLSISESEVVVAVVPVFDEVSDEDTLFPTVDEGSETLQIHTTPVLVLPSETEVTEPLNEPAIGEGTEITERVIERPFAEVAVGFEDEITAKLDKSPFPHPQKQPVHLWSVSLIDLVPNLVFGFVALNVILFMTNLVL